FLDGSEHVVGVVIHRGEPIIRDERGGAGNSGRRQFWHRPGSRLASGAARSQAVHIEATESKPRPASVRPRAWTGVAGTRIGSAARTDRSPKGRQVARPRSRKVGNTGGYSE